MQKSKLKGKIFLDCCKAMFLPQIFSIFSEGSLILITLFSSTVLGEFASAVFESAQQNALISIKQIVLFLIGGVLIVPLFNLLCNTLMIKAALKHDRILLNKFLSKKSLYNLGLDAGDVQYRLENDPIDLRYYIMEIQTKIAVLPIAIVFLIIELLKINKMFCIITIFVSFINLVLPAVLKDIEKKYDRLNREYAEDIRSMETQLTTQPCIVKHYDMKGYILNKLDAMFQHYYKDTKKKYISYSVWTSNIAILINILSVLSILLIGSIFVSKELVGVGSVAAMVGYRSVFEMIFSDLGFIILKTPILKNITDRLSIFYEDQDEATENVPDHKMTITAKNLSFQYNDTARFFYKPFQINEGDKVLISGPNGTGKTTLLNILAGIHRDYQGELTISNIALKRVSMHSWTSRMSYDMQDSFLFEGTVNENILLDNIEVSNERVTTLLRALNIYSLKDKKISFEQKELSGGERKKVTLARTLIRETPLLILDEPSNHLDQDGISLISNYIKNSDKTIIFTSHNEEIISLANKNITLG